MTVIGFGGYAGSGKDEAASVLVEEFGFERRGFADALKDMAYELNPLLPVSGPTRLQDVVQSIGWDLAKQNKEVRRLLQTLGMECRALNQNIWVNHLFEKPWMDLVIPDVRFTNEVFAIKQYGGTIIWIERPGRTPALDHISEQRIYSDLVIHNDGDVLNLQRLVRETVKPLLPTQETE